MVNDSWSLLYLSYFILYFQWLFFGDIQHVQKQCSETPRYKEILVLLVIIVLRSKSTASSDVQSGWIGSGVAHAILCMFWCTFFRKLTVNCNNGNMLILIILWDTLWDNIWDHWHFYKHLVFVASDWCQRFHFTHPLPDHTRYAHPETMKSTSTSPFFPIINHTRSSRCVFHIFSPEKNPWDFHRNSRRALETGLFATGQCPRSHPWRSGDGEMKGRSESDLENFWRMPGK